jgi:hypothetical protein
MSIFSRLFRNVKRGLRKIAPLAAPILGIALPGIGGAIGGALLGGIGGGGRTPPIVQRPPLPGGGFVQPAAVRRAAARPIIQLPPVGTPVTSMSIFSSLPAILSGGARVGRAAGRVLTGRTAAAAGAGVLVGQLLPDGSAGACPSGFHMAKDGSGRCVRNRRMNFGNARAARRSVRRLKGARKLLQDIEKMMPRRPAARRRDLAPGHTHVR